jgi:hypothetical protein
MDAAFRVAELPASRGVAWITQAAGLFRRAPLAWIGLCAGWLAIWFALASLPLIQRFAPTLLQPLFFAGLAIAAYKQGAGEPVTMAELFGGFRRNARGLMVVGLVMVLLQQANFLLMQAVGGIPEWPASEPFDIVKYGAMLRERWWVLAIGFLFASLVSGALWFAPQLLVFHAMPVSHAIRWSVYAALANIGAMLVYGVAMTVVFFIAWIPLGLGLIVAIPLMVISTYTSYRDVFEPAPRAPAAAAAA